MDLEQLKRDLVNDEGLIPHLYDDGQGNHTFGVGRNIDGNPLTTEELYYLLKHGEFSEELCLWLLGKDIEKCEQVMKKNYPWVAALSDGRQRALFNMMFWLGPVRFSKFGPTLALIKAGRYRDAAERIPQNHIYVDSPARCRRIMELLVRG